jgi:cell division protein FtsA
VLHLIPRLYAVDGLKGIRNPVGMHALRLDVETLCIVSASAAVQNLVHATENAGLKSRGVVFSALAAGEATLTRDEKEMGVVLVEIGGGATTVALFQQGTLWNAAVLPVGGHQFTTDLAVALNAPYEVAEKVKLHHGQANLDGIGDDYVELQAFGDRRTVRVERREICRFLQDRAEELFRLVQLKVSEFGLPAIPPAGIVLSGGGASLPGIDKVARRIVASPVRIGTPSGMQDLPQGMESPAYNASVGTVLWGVRNLASSREVGQRGGRRTAMSNGHARAGGGPLGWLKGRLKGASV